MCILTSHFHLQIFHQSEVVELFSQLQMFRMMFSYHYYTQYFLIILLTIIIYGGSGTVVIIITVTVTSAFHFCTLNSHLIFLKYILTFL